MRRFVPIPAVLLLLAGCSALLLIARGVRADDLKPALADSKLTFGGEFRLRGEGFNNPLDLADSLRDGYSYYRFRTRVWLEGKPRPGLHAYFRLGNEYRWGRGEKVSGVRDDQGKVSVDNAWAEIDIPVTPGLSFRFGRQDLLYGEGFLVWDGTPADGSSSSYFDALKLTWAHEKTTIDLLALKMDEEGFGTPARDEDLYGLYARLQHFDLYTLYRHKRGETKTDTGIVHPVQQTTAIGGRAAFLPDTGFHLAAEGAYETGSFAAEEERAFGGYCRGGWTSPGRLHPAVELGGVYLSGDDPSSSRHEGWDGFYSEWPKYSELYVYTLYDQTSRVLPNDPGTWTNFVAAWVEARLKAGQTLSSAARVSLFRAPEKTGPGSGDDRGLLLAAQVNVRLASDLQGQLLGEAFDPGDYYARDASSAWYGRWSITARF
jgi:hypothetical protein